MDSLNKNHVLEDNKSILVVDDDGFLRDLLFRYLSQQGYRVLVAETGKEAIEQARKTVIQIALIDILLAEMSGIELIDKLKECHQETILIMMTGHPSMETALQAMKKGVQDYLIKPFKLEQLDEILKKSLETKRIILENKRLQAELIEAKEQLKKYQALVRQSHLVTSHPSGETSQGYARGDAAYRFQSLRKRESAIQESLNKLVLLKEEGIISEEEFEAKQKQLISMGAKVSTNGTS